MAPGPHDLVLRDLLASAPREDTSPKSSIRLLFNSYNETRPAASPLGAWPADAPVLAEVALTAPHVDAAWRVARSRWTRRRHAAAPSSSWDSITSSSIKS